MKGKIWRRFSNRYTRKMIYSIYLQRRREEDTARHILHPGLKSNIVSLGQATEAGCEVSMKGDVLMLYDRLGGPMVKTTRAKNRLYKVRLEVYESVECLKIVMTESNKWHARLGHVNTETMRTMIKNKLVVGIPGIEVEKETCKSCLLGKQVRQPFPKSTTFRASRPLELVHRDLCGPITPSTQSRKRYVFVLIDDHTRYMWTILLSDKSEAFDKFKCFKAVAEQEIKGELETFRTDRGG